LDDSVEDDVRDVGRLGEGIGVGEVEGGGEGHRLQHSGRGPRRDAELGLMLVQAVGDGVEQALPALVAVRLGRMAGESPGGPVDGRWKTAIASARVRRISSCRMLTIAVTRSSSC
jgi:hypothetical protein